MRRNPPSALRTAIIIVLTAASAAGHAADRFPSETWMGVYLSTMKVGYARLLADKADVEGKPGFRFENTSVITVSLLGDQVEQKLNTVALLNSDYEPVKEVFTMSSGGVSTVVTARFTLTEIIADVDAGGTKSSKKIPIPPGSRLIGDDTAFRSQDHKLEVGDKMTFKSFSPLTLTLDDVQVEVLRTADLVLQDGPHHCLVVKSSTPLGNATSWEDEGGSLLRIEMDMGFTMVRETKESARAKPGEYAPPSDLAVLTSAQTKTKVPDPRKTRYLKVRLAGFEDKTLVVSDGRQKATFSGGDKPSAEYEIKASDFDQSKSVSLPIKDKAMDEFLADGPYIEASDVKMKATALQIVGEEKNAFRAASKIRAWVASNIKMNGEIGLVRSATEILGSRVGVCRDYAVLYAALARAAGIPTKVVTGMTYWRDGFYYHAWAESFVGEWISIDATLDTTFVDATHIKLAEGDATAMFKAVKAVGILKAEVLEFR